MIKAKFDAKQPELAMYREGNSMRYMIAENGKQYTEKDSEGNETKGWEYDFNEWHDSTTDPDAVKADPEKYLTYSPVDDLPEPERTKTTEARLVALEKAQEATDQAVQDMILAQLGG